MSDPLLNRWTYCAQLTIPAATALGVAVDMGITNNPPGIRLRARVASPGVLTGAHALHLFEGRTISNTSDPVHGAHRSRKHGNQLPEWLRLKLGMAIDDIHVFHPPGSFQDGGGGVELFSSLGSASVDARMRRFELTPIPAGRYYLLQVSNLEPTPSNLSLILDYEFVRP